MKTHTQNVFKAGVALLIAALFLGTTVSAVQDSPRFGAVPSSIQTVKPLSEEKELSYYTDIYTSICVQGGTPPYDWKSAIRLSDDELGPYRSWTLTKIVAAYEASYQPEMNAQIIIYTMGTETRPGSMIQSFPVTMNQSDYYTFELPTPINVTDHEELWLCVQWHQLEDGFYVAPLDSGPHVPNKGDWVNLGSGWQSLAIASGGAIDGNWVIGGIVSGAGNAQMQIGNVKGPIGVSAEIANIEDVDAMNVDWTMSVTGKSINKTASGTIPTLAAGANAPISTGLIFGFGKVTIKISASADNAESVSISKTAFVLLFLVLKVQ